MPNAVFAVTLEKKTKLDLKVEDRGIELPTSEFYTPPIGIASLNCAFLHNLDAWHRELLPLNGSVTGSVVNDRHRCGVE